MDGRAEDGTEQGDRERYAGRPLLKLLDAWILDAIGALDEGTAGQLGSHGQRIAAALGIEAAAWQDAVVAALRMPGGAADAVRRLWDQTRSDAIVSGTEEPHPLAFARGVADARMLARLDS